MFDFSEENSVLLDLLVNGAMESANFVGYGENREKAEGKIFSFPTVRVYVERWIEGEDSSCSWSYFVGQAFLLVNDQSTVFYTSRKFAYFPSAKDGNAIRPRGRTKEWEPIRGEEDVEADEELMWAAIERIAQKLADHLSDKKKRPSQPGLVITHNITDMLST